MAKEPTTEYRVVCGKHGQRGHSSHTWSKGSKQKAVQSVIDLNHHAEIHPNLYYADEAPYEVQEREVGAWGRAEVSA